VLTHLAARRLSDLARVEPQLSPDWAILNVTDRALSAVDALIREARPARRLA